MSRIVKREILESLQTLYRVNEVLPELQKGGEYEKMTELLIDCQGSAIEIGTRIDRIWGEGNTCILCLEGYCESVYQMSLCVSDGQAWENEYQKACKQLDDFEGIFLKEIPDKMEMVFLPYKASMWDSLESIWMAADADLDCDVYVIPIPYYEKNRDKTLGTYHYEGQDMPEYVPVVDYEAYELADRKPDVIYIHNPYDYANQVTSIDPRFYSKELKKYTELLVYVPYYSTAGGMSETRAMCPVYLNVDYIVIQGEKYRTFFYASIPDEKLIPLGSPKFDRVIRLCKNPPEPPVHWKAKMRGKKVYFYNTSLAGMLDDTKRFLLKMEYVFKIFNGREDACLLWRPHPLLESTLDSMRGEFRPFFDVLKNYFLSNQIGIYDDTPDVEKTIALCDAYIGDMGSSVISLFGIVGKPIFILKNNISSLPEPDDWRGEIINMFFTSGSSKWIVTQGNKLYHAPEQNYKYEYFCDLSGWAYGGYYSWVLTIDGRDYVCPLNAQDILRIGENGIDNRIVLKRLTEKNSTFYGAVGCGRYLFLIPDNYPAIVRYDTMTDEVRYFGEYLDIFIRKVDGQKRLGGFCAWKEYVFIASPTDNQVLAIHADTGKMQILSTGANNKCGCFKLIADKNDLWFLPYFGDMVIGWNPNTGEVKEYACCLENFKCIHPMLGYECMEKPFGVPAVSGEWIYLPPHWGNMYVRLNKRTGAVTEWKAELSELSECPDGYYASAGNASFVEGDAKTHAGYYYLLSMSSRKLYEVDFETDQIEEVNIEFDLNELEQHEPGFAEHSEWLRYACYENAFNTLADFLDDNIKGEKFDSARQVQAYGEITANYDGTCGFKIHKFIRSKLLGE